MKCRVTSTRRQNLVFFPLKFHDQLSTAGIRATEIQMGGLMTEKTSVANQPRHSFLFMARESLQVRYFFADVIAKVLLRTLAKKALVQYKYNSAQNKIDTPNETERYDSWVHGPLSIVIDHLCNYVQ